MTHAAETRSTCPYCGVGCGVIIESRDGRITGVRGDPDHPANFGRLCTKGSTLHLTAGDAVTRQARLLQPLRRERRGATPQPLGWEAALDHAAAELHRIVAAHGPDAVGFYISGQLLTEDYYVFNKLARGLVGTNNIDSNSRLCMSSAVAAYKMTLGADAPPCCYEDLLHADCLFIAGSNTAWAHPVLFRRIEEARAARPHMRVVCCDPRRTETAGAADLFLQIAPGTDVLLFHGMLHVMLRQGWTRPDWIAAHTAGFAALEARVRACTPEAVARACGIREEDLRTAARWFATSGATLSLYCQGLNQSASGTAKNAALINLHLATAQIGRPGAGPFSLTGQPNAMGGREVGGMATLLSAHRDIGNPAHRAEMAAFWGVSSVPERPGRTAVELFEAAADGAVKALWIACTNPAQSMPHQAAVRRALQRAEFVLVQEAFATTATCAFADLLLPAATWGEKEGTVTNSERRISRVRAAVPPAGSARPDWQIVVDVARRLEARMGRKSTLFPYASPEAIWREHRATTRGRDLDITGMSYALLDRAPQQWPLREGEAQGRARLYEDGVFATPDGKARFADVAWQPLADPPDAAHPFSLVTGRLRDQWHGMSRTGTLGRLFGHVPEPAVQLHPQDLAQRGIAAGDLVAVTSRRGAIVLPAQPAPGLAPGQAFVAMHWGGEFIGGAGANALTTSAFCPAARQPELKHAAVDIRKADLPWQLVALAWLPADEALRAQHALQALMPAFAFAACVPFAAASPLAAAHAQPRQGVLLRVAAHEATSPGLLARIEACLDLQAPDALRYEDRHRGQRRVIRVRREGEALHLQGLLLAGDTRAEGWLKALLQEERPVQAGGHLLLAGSAQPPQHWQPPSRQVCSCLGVDATAIEQHLAAASGDAAQRLASLQANLHCGTRCGSCLPELRRMACALAPLPHAA